jgi:hypothetical protein
MGGALLLISPCLLGFLSAYLEDSKSYPGKVQFEAEDNKISVYANTAAFGNSTDAIKVAADFSEMLDAECKLIFRGGSTFTPATMGHLLTNCQVMTKGVVILCQVPDMRGYQDDVRDELAKLAWQAAQISAHSLKLPDETPLAVGLRGFGSYGTIWEGKLKGDPVVKSDGLTEKHRLYPYFVP